MHGFHMHTRTCVYTHTHTYTLNIHMMNDECSQGILLFLPFFYTSKLEPQIPLKPIIFSLVFTVYLAHMLHRKRPLSPQPIIWHAFLTDE